MLTQDVAKNFEHVEHFSADRQQARPVQDVSCCVTMYVELITILVRAKDDITRACRRCQSTLYIVFNIAKVGGPHYVTLAGTVGNRIVLNSCRIHESRSSMA